MNRYTGMKCPYCGQPFEEGDLVAVCPECGAPYHRHCFEQMNGVCMFAQKHAEGFDWNKQQEQEKKQQQRFYEDTSKIRCPRCGTQNSVDNIFCAVCGTPLHRPDESGYGNQPNMGQAPFGFGGWQQGAGQQNQPGAGQGPQGPFRTMGYNPYTTPYGGLSPDEEIDGISAKDLAIFVGENTQYYLPKFKEMKTTGKNTINWAAFLLEFMFLIYRKMYLLAVIVFLVSNLVSFGAMFMITGGSFSAITPQMVNMITMMSYAVSLATRFIVGFSFNRIYMNHCFKRIRQLKEQYPDEQEYYAHLTKKGAVSRKALIAVVVAYFVVSMLFTYALILFVPV